ncbi:hypothetical protein GO599_02015 [Sulfolobus islandicus]|uniref:hypothetical protein n=2 Tax=Saccharolobus islandicus TaxID=43080 RepID=UPI00037E21BB|nr:hypothetical protein [Sulfolobus islandicus]WCM36428.1 hypothetical protein GO599_02015 [Sulfolobus islandicus]
MIERIVENNINFLTSCLYIRFSIINIKRETSENGIKIKLEFKREPMLNDGFDYQQIEVITDNSQSELLEVRGKLIIQSAKVRDKDIIMYIDLIKNSVIVDEIYNENVLREFELGDCKNADIIFNEIIEEGKK